MIKLFKGDCLIESDKIESGSVDLILTDLPYGTIINLYKNTGWDVIIDPNKIFIIANRILRKNGKMILFAQEPFSSSLINSATWEIPFNQRLIWEKDSCGNMLFAKKACVNFHEDVLVFTKIETGSESAAQKYINNELLQSGKNKHSFREVLTTDVIGHTFTKPNRFRLPTQINYLKIKGIANGYYLKTYKQLQNLNNKDKKSSTFNLWEGKKYKSNILKYKKDYNGFHPTQKPVLLLEDLIKTFSNEGDLVVDLTMGSGSTGVACVNTNRNFTGIEKDETYFNIAKERMKN